MRTDRGIPWNLIKAGLQDLAGNPYTSHLYTRGGLWFRGKKSSTNTQYVLDISEIATASFYASSYRIAGPTLSLSDLLNQVCSDAGQDYYVELLKVGQNNVIK